MSKITGIKYINPIQDGSGYAKAGRGYVLALHKLGIPITVSPISFEKILPELGKDGEVLQSLINKDIDYNVVIVHTTPEFWKRFKEPDKTMVNFTIWETTKLHSDWVGYINNNATKVLVGCDWNVDVFKESGITIPIAAVPHAIPIEDSKQIKNYNIKGINEDTFVFYDIFQWTERKDPVSLIKAYWYAFRNNEDVALVLKAYRGDYSDTEKDAIRSTINRLKQVTRLGNYPPIYFISDILTEDEIRGLHNRCDCYVTLNRGEGFGLSPFQAGAYGKPVIATGFGGVTEYLKKENSYLVNYTLTPVHGMPWSPWYKADQLWAQADVVDGANKMLHVYNNQEEAKEKGKQLQKYINTNFSYDVIGKKMIKEIEEVL